MKTSLIGNMLVGHIIIKDGESIKEANRLVYEISNNQIIVKSCKGHYSD